MRRVIVALVLSALVPVTAFAGTAVATTDSDKGQFELTVTTSLDPKTPEVGTCTAVLKDKKTGEVLAAPKISFKVGEAVETNSISEHSKFTLKLKSDAASNSATVEVEYTLANEVVFAPTVTLELG